MTDVDNDVVGQYLYSVIKFIKSLFYTALEIPADLPSSDVIDRWVGEPVKCAILNTNVFLTNKKGFPVLSKAHQSLVMKLFKVSPWSVDHTSLLSSVGLLKTAVVTVM